MLKDTIECIVGSILSIFAVMLSFITVFGVPLLFCLLVSYLLGGGLHQ